MLTASRVKPTITDATVNKISWLCERALRLIYYQPQETLSGIFLAFGECVNAVR